MREGADSRSAGVGPGLVAHVCVHCGRDWTDALLPIMGSPGVTMEALCGCGHMVLADGSEDGIFLIDGLVEEAVIDP